MAIRWLRLRQTQACWALLFCLSVSVPPGGDKCKFWMGWSIWLGFLKEGQCNVMYLSVRRICSKDKALHWKKYLNRGGLEIKLTISCFGEFSNFIFEYHEAHTILQRPTFKDSRPCTRAQNVLSAAQFCAHSKILESLQFILTQWFFH